MLDSPNCLNKKEINTIIVQLSGNHITKIEPGVTVVRGLCGLLFWLNTHITKRVLSSTHERERERERPRMKEGFLFGTLVTFSF